MSMKKANSQRTLPPLYDFNAEPDAQLAWLDEIEEMISPARSYSAKNNAEHLVVKLRHIAKKMVKSSTEFIKLSKKGNNLSTEEDARKAAAYNLLGQLEDDFDYDAIRLQRYAEEVSFDIRSQSIPIHSSDRIISEYQIKMLAPELLLAVHFLLRCIRPYSDLVPDIDQEIRRRADQGRGESLWCIEALLWGQVHFLQSTIRKETGRGEIHESYELQLAKLLLENGLADSMYHLSMSKEGYQQYGRHIEIRGLISRSQYLKEVYEYHSNHGNSLGWSVGTIMPLLEVLDRARYDLSKDETLPKTMTENVYPVNGFLTPFSLDYLTHMDKLAPFFQQLLNEYLSAFISVPTRINFPRTEEQPMAWKELKNSLVSKISSICKQKGDKEIWVDSELLGNQPGIPEALLAFELEGMLSITDIQVTKKEDRLLCQLKLEDLNLKTSKGILPGKNAILLDTNMYLQPSSEKKEDLHAGIWLRNSELSEWELHDIKPLSARIIRHLFNIRKGNPNAKTVSQLALSFASTSSSISNQIKSVSKFCQDHNCPHILEEAPDNAWRICSRFASNQ